MGACDAGPMGPFQTALRVTIRSGAPPIHRGCAHNIGTPKAPGCDGFCYRYALHDHEIACAQRIDATERGEELRRRRRRCRRRPTRADPCVRVEDHGRIGGLRRRAGTIDTLVASEPAPAGRRRGGRADPVLAAHEV